MPMLPVATGLPQSLTEWAEFAVLFVVLFVALRFLRRTVAGGVFRGPGLLVWVFLLGFALLVRALDFGVLEYLFTGFVPILLTGLVVLFQPELRHGLARLGEGRFFARLFPRLLPRRKGADRAPEVRVVDEIVAAVRNFGRHKIGALIAVERGVDLTAYLDTGVRIDARIRAELLDAIFSSENLLHDGAVIVRRDRIAAAACRLPLTERTDLPFRFGTRHRAAVGLSEQSDALVVVVSEETGAVHVAERGEIRPHAEPYQWLASELSIVIAERAGVARAEP